LLALFPEEAEGILGEEAAVYRITGTGNLPEDIRRTAVELQEAAAKIRSKQTANQAAEGYWKAPSVDQKWSKEARCLSVSRLINNKQISV
jgi:predicted chitinase